MSTRRPSASWTSTAPRGSGHVVYLPDPRHPPHTVPVLATSSTTCTPSYVDLIAPYDVASVIHRWPYRWGIHAQAAATLCVDTR